MNWLYMSLNESAFPNSAVWDFGSLEIWLAMCIPYDSLTSLERYWLLPDHWDNAVSPRAF